MTTTSNRRRAIAVGLGLLSTLAAGCTGGDDVATPDDPGGAVVSGEATGSYFGAELASPYAMPDITLDDTSGQPFNLVTDTTSPITLVFFGYTNCPDLCPLVMSDVTLALTRVPAAVRAQAELVFITTDPNRDTPATLRAYLDRYDPRYIGLTGPLPDIVAAATAMGVGIEGHKRLASGGYDVSHGAQVIGFMRDRAPVVWTEGTPVDDIVDDLVTLAGP